MMSGKSLSALDLLLSVSTRWIILLIFWIRYHLNYVGKKKDSKSALAAVVVRSSSLGKIRMLEQFDNHLQLGHCYSPPTLISPSMLPFRIFTVGKRQGGGIALSLDLKDIESPNNMSKSVILLARDGSFLDVRSIVH